MTATFLLIIISVFAIDIDKIAVVNKLKKEAEAAYANAEFNEAISTLRTLTDSLGVSEDPVYLNLANAYFQSSDTTNALQYYSRVVGSENDELSSVAYQQIGVVLQQQNKLQEALNSFKLALKANPENEDARYNYEMLKQMLDQQQQDQQNENEDIEPSEYAKRLKQQADNLVAQNLFNQALQIMQMGLQEDETVAAYNEFIAKLSDVVESKQ